MTDGERQNKFNNLAEAQTTQLTVKFGPIFLNNSSIYELQALKEQILQPTQRKANLTLAITLPQKIASLFQQSSNAV